jgi:uncharacterized phage protein (TIGR02220 family)
MAENKKSFIAYSDWQETFEELSDEEAGKLVKHLFNYVNDKNPEASDKLTKMCFIPIKQSLKRDLVKYDNYIDKQRVNGKKGGRPKKNPTLSEETQPFLEKPKKADSVNDSVSVNESDTNINKVKTLDFDKLLFFIKQETRREFRTINKSVQNKYKARLRDGYLKADIQNAIKYACSMQYHKDNGFQYLTPEFFSRADTLDKYGSKSTNEVKTNHNLNPAN